MLNTLNVTVPSFSGFLALGGIFLILIYAYAGSDAADAVDFKCDRALRDRMNQLGIPTWKDLATKSSLTRMRLRLVRGGAIAQLPLSQLMQLATALNWNLDELLHNFGIFSTSAVATNSAEIEELRQQCLRLRDELQQQKTQLISDFRNDAFEQLRTLLTNYPSARKMAEVKPDLPAKNLSALFTPLDNLLEIWGFEKIGSAWEQVAYNPQLHQPDVEDILEGELVYIRFVGYRDRERILCPAKVSRTLPGGIKS